MSHRATVTAAAIVAVTAAVLGLVSTVSSGVGWPELVEGNAVGQGVAAISIATVGAIVLQRLPGHVLGRLFLGIGLVEAAGLLAGGIAAHLSADGSSGPVLSVTAWLSGWIWLPGFLALLSAVVLLFPDGRVAAPWWRPVLGLAAVATLVATVGAAMVRDLTRGVAAGAENPVAVADLPDDLLYLVVIVAMGMAAACGLAGMVGLAVRMVRARGRQRRQLGWFFLAFAALVAGQLSTSPVLAIAGTAALSVGLGIAMLRHGLFDGDRLLGPTVVYAVLTVGVTGVFGLAAGLLGGQVGDDATAAVIAALVVALALAPVRNAVQRMVDRALYGGRRDPYEVLAGVGARLGRVLDPDVVPGEIVAAVAAAVRVPHVALTLAGEDEPVAAHGVAPHDAVPVELPIRHGGVEVGSLAIGLRRGRRHLDPMDERLLGDVAAHVGPAVRGVLLVRELRVSRDRLVDERDAERARIRHDLHDGIGPVLAGVALGIEAATRAPVRSAELLARLVVDVHAGLADVRRIVADLRPSELDDGLVPALRRFAATVTDRSGGTLLVEVDAPTVPLRLPDRVEVTSYRITMEAVTNVVRHAGAARCCIRVAVGGTLRLEVLDDGRGLPPSPVPGIGRASMARRAAELGGTCTVITRPDGGTAVVAELPLACPPAAEARAGPGRA